MDYSASIHETEDPAASPWGNPPGSSPQHDHTTFPSLTGDAPVPPFPYTPQSPNGLGQGGEDSFPQSGVATPSAGGGHDAATLAASLGPGAIPQAAGYEGAPQPTAATDAQSEDAQQPRKPPQPQFRLQAKITGLERTGKKDPILRFDVHVSCPFSILLAECPLETNWLLLDEPAPIPHHPVPRCPTFAFRVC
jgi:hypothetical protein